MAKQIFTKEQIIKDLKEIFSIPEEQDNKSFMNAYETNGSFGINKQFMERHPVIGKLQEYFNDKMFEEGLGLIVSSITMVYTTFEIKYITPKQTS